MALKEKNNIISFENIQDSAKPLIEYTASNIEVLEGLEPVRKRPGMYIGGTDLGALHHLVKEAVDNAIDEMLAGFASNIEVYLYDDGSISIKDNGRGIPIDQHPKYPDKSALEVIMTTLHSGGKFSNGTYKTPSGLHGVGVSVVNALSAWLEVSVVRDNTQYTQRYERGVPVTSLTSKKVNAANGTEVRFLPDSTIFPDIKFNPQTILEFLTSKAYLRKGAKIDWRCDNSIAETYGAMHHVQIYFQNGLADYLHSLIADKQIIGRQFTIASTLKIQDIELEWAFAWTLEEAVADKKFFCNTIHNVLGGTHEIGLKNGLTKAVRHYASLIGHKRIDKVSPEDIISHMTGVLSVFIPNPSFQGQTKDKLLNPEVAKYVENAIQSQLEQWLIEDKESAIALLDFFADIAEFRKNAKLVREVGRKTAIKGLRLPGKLADCVSSSTSETELFIVEGDSAGGTAKQARDKKFQAILPLRGKIINVASNSMEKIAANQELKDLITALGCGIGKQYKETALRYNKVIIMTDADVDGSHIASLLMTFFYLNMPELIKNGHLYIAQPPLYKIKHKNDVIYAHNDLEKEKILKSFGKNAEVGRFKGLGEMNPAQLKDTTMSVEKRVLLKVMVNDTTEAESSIQVLMGKKPELRFQFIKESRQNLLELDV